MRLIFSKKFIIISIFISQLSFLQSTNLKTSIISSGIVNNNLMKGTIGQPFISKSNSNSINLYSGFWSSSSINLLQNDDILPVKFEILNAYPNPFNPTVNIDFSIPEKGLLEIKIYDLTGRLIFSNEEKLKIAGKYSFQWHAENNLNKKVSSGIYMMRINLNGITKNQKITNLK